MPSYLVETFLARGATVDRAALEGLASSAAAAMTKAGTRVGYSGSIHVPEDEVCFFAFEASAAEHVVAVARRAGLQPARIVEASSSMRGVAP
jgi:hypothetical protein